MDFRFEKMHPVLIIIERQGSPVTLTPGVNRLGPFQQNTGIIIKPGYSQYHKQHYQNAIPARPVVEITLHSLILSGKLSLVSNACSYQTD